MRNALERISKQKIIVKEGGLPSPFGFSIMVDRLNRDKLTTETLEESIKKNGSGKVVIVRRAALIYFHTCKLGE